MTSEHRKKQIAVSNKRRRDALKNQYKGGGTVYYMTIETKEKVRHYQQLMSYSTMTYAIDDLVRLGLKVIDNETKTTVQKRLKDV